MSATASGPEDLRFERRPFCAHDDRHHRYVVSFLRGSVIECGSERAARALTARHLARSRRHGLEEAVLSAVWFAPELQRRQQRA